jgi:5-methyltetrahydropteroyltriglutamate--homocysteine methyltransferase
VVGRQAEAGIDIVSDGEMSKIGYATYIKDRYHGFSGDSPRRVPGDLALFPNYVKKIAEQGQTPKLKRPKCTGEISVKDEASLTTDIANLQRAVAGTGVAQGFMNAASPGVISVFQPNEYYVSEDAYLEALSEAMRGEYEAIVAAGLVIQLDCPDLAMGRHTMHSELSDAEFLKRAEAQVEALNHALRNVPADMARMHLCWGNYEGPHVCDVALEKIIHVVKKVKPQVLSFEASNPRHAHEWTVWRDAGLPDDKVLLPGVIDSVSNFVEHPDYVAERICRFADIVGRERVLAGSDCGFATFAGFGKIDPDICYAKLGALAEGAAIASKRLW